MITESFDNLHTGGLVHDAVRRSRRGALRRRDLLFSSNGACTTVMLICAYDLNRTRIFSPPRKARFAGERVEAWHELCTRVCEWSGK